MPVDDLWYLKKRGPNDKRIPSRLYGRGKRWRVRYTDAVGEPHTKFFDRKVDAEAFESNARAGVVIETAIDQSEARTTFFDYGERWRESRRITQLPDHRRHTESRLRHHIYPYFGKRLMRAITVTDVLEWIAKLLQKKVAQSSVKTYFDVFNALMNAAVADKVIPDNPCKAIKLSAILRGFSRAPKWVPTPEQVVRLREVVPDRYLAAIDLGAKAGYRIGEVLGFEDGTRSADHNRSELHVVQQLKFHNAEYGGFYLAPPKAGSVGTVDLDDELAAVLAEHVKKYPPVVIELVDITGGTPDPGKAPKRRMAPFLFTDDQGRPIHDQRWSDMFKSWCAAAGWPKEATFHSLRHFFATMLIAAGADPTEVQRALRHKLLRTTLETYVHWWPRKQRMRNVVSDALRRAKEGMGS